MKPSMPCHEPVLQIPLLPSFPHTSPHLCGYRVLLDQGLLRQMDLKRVICGQRHGQAAGKEGGHGVAVVVEEELHGKCGGQAG